MKDNLTKIKLFLHELESLNLLNSIERLDLFYDEPKFFKYVASLNYPKKNSDGFPPHEAIVAGGFSFASKYDALIKCLGESIERLSLYCYKKNQLPSQALEI